MSAHEAEEEEAVSCWVAAAGAVGEEEEEDDEEEDMMVKTISPTAAPIRNGAALSRGSRDCLCW